MEQKIDYNKIMNKVLSELSGGEKLLLHSCCGPCSSSVIEKLSKFFDITVYYYNPNIFPKEEYEKRKSEQIKLISLINNKYNSNIKFIDCDYNNQEFKDAICGMENLGEGSKRCWNCFKLRLEKTAKIAAENKFDFFTTTLSVSPHKNVNWICEILTDIGNELEKKGFKTKPLLADFKKENGYLRSIELSKEFELYRQNYCGCTPNKI